MPRITGKRNAIEKAMEVMLNFQGGKPVWGIRELAADLAFSPATVQRILSTLKTYGFVRQDPGTRQYYIGSVFYHFLDTLNHSDTLTGTGRRFMESVARDTGETVHLNVVRGSSRRCIHAIESSRELAVRMQEGSTFPLYAGASAKCLLAFSSRQFRTDYLDTVSLVPLTCKTITDRRTLEKELRQIRRQGYAISLGERTPGQGTVSAPVFDYRGELLAALSLSIPDLRISRKAYLARCIEILTREALAFSHDMGLASPKPKKTFTGQTP